MLSFTRLITVQALALLLAVQVCGCGDDSTPADSSLADTGTSDSGTLDSATTDSGADTGTIDGGTDGAADTSTDGSADGSTDALPDASMATVSIEWVTSIGGTPLSGVTVRLLDSSDTSIVLGTGASDASGISTITLETLPASHYIAHGSLAGHHDTYFYAPDTHIEAPTVMGVPLVSDGVWDATYTGAMLTEAAGTGWILVRGRTAAGGGVTDMTATTTAGGVVRYLSGGLLHDGSSSPDGEGIILNAEASAATIEIMASGSTGMSSLVGQADATVASIITLP